MSGQPGAPPAALAGGAARAQLGAAGMMPLQLGPPPGRAEDAILVSGFTEEQLATLKRQVCSRAVLLHGLYGCKRERASARSRACVTFAAFRVAPVLTPSAWLACRSLNTGA